jgi:hypothetical protein
MLSPINARYFSFARERSYVKVLGHFEEATRASPPMNDAQDARATSN